MKVALYMRVSTEDQENENQDLRLREVAEIRGYDIVGIYTDKESGGKRSRPGLDKMIKDARRGRFNGIMAVKVDRIARSLQDLLEIAGNLGSYGVDLLFTDQDLDISSSQGKLMFQILGAFAEYEREIIQDRTKAGLRRARREGKRIGRPGIHHKTKEKVRKLRLDGLSYREISEKVTYKTKKGKVKHISRTQISRILSEGVPKRGGEKSGVTSVEEGTVSKTDVLGTEGVESDV